MISLENTGLQVIGQAQSVILASGTLSPFDSLKAQAFPEQKVKTFACGHVIPRDHLLAVALQKGPSGDDLDFRHKKRSEAKSFEQLGRLLVNFCQVVPQARLMHKPSPEFNSSERQGFCYFHRDFCIDPYLYAMDP